METLAKLVGGLIIGLIIYAIKIYGERDVNGIDAPDILKKNGKD